MQTNFYRATAPRKARRPRRWASDPTPPRAPYRVDLLAAWRRGYRRYWVGRGILWLLPAQPPHPCGAVARRGA